jgi:hypothetical protein
MHVRSSETEGNRAYAVSGGVMSSTRSFAVMFALLMAGCGDDEQLAATCPGCAGASGGAAGSAGSAGAGAASGAGGAAGTSGSKCTEFRVEPSILPPTRDWVAEPKPYIDLPLHPFWLDGSGVHVAWESAAADTSTPSLRHGYLFVTSFDGVGTLYGEQQYDVFPSGLDAGWTEPIAAAANPDGAVAIAYRYRLSPQVDPSEHILLAKLGEPTFQTIWDVPWSAAQFVIWQLGWDGEAFAVHIGSVNDGGIRLVRLSPEGAVLSGPDLVGSASILPDSYSVETDSASGRTVFASEGAPGVWLSGHERDGTPLFPSDPNLGAGIEAVGVKNGGSFFPGAALEKDDVLLSWMDVYKDSYVQRVTDLAPAGNAIVIPFEDDEPWGLGHRALSKATGGWTMLAESISVHLDAFDIANDAIVDRRTVVRKHAFESCWKSQTCPANFPGLDARYLDLVRYQDELWLGFLDNSDGYTNPETHPVQLLAYRIVDARAPCLFDSLYDEHHPQ